LPRAGCAVARNDEWEKEVVMRKVLFDVMLPATGRSYELWVPKELTVFEATQLVARILAEQESRFFEPSKETALFDGVTGDELGINERIGALGYANGTRLILV
jgi:hypothetical protein